MTPDGHIVHLLVEQDIPMLDEMHLICQPVWPDHTFTVIGPRDALASAPATQSATAGDEYYTLPPEVRTEPIRFKR